MAASVAAWWRTGGVKSEFGKSSGNGVRRSSWAPSGVQFGVRSPRTRALEVESRPRRILVKAEAKKQTFSSLEELLAESEKAVLVDFYATWCGPCQLMGPILEEVGASLSDRVRVVKIDTEKYPAIADQYDIQALPTFILFKEGLPADRFEGAMNASQLIQRIQQSL